MSLVFLDHHIDVNVVGPRYRTQSFQGRNADEAFNNVRISCNGEIKKGCTNYYYKFSTPPPRKVGKQYVTQSVTLTATITVITPTWAGYRNASPEQKARWDALVARVKQHEEGHVRIDRAGAYRVANAIPDSAPTIKALQAKENANFRRVYNEIRSENRTYDQNNP